LASKCAKSVGNSNFCFKNAKKVLKVSTKIEKSQKVSTKIEKSQKVLTNLNISISLKSLDKNLVAAKSQFKSLNFKNLDQEKKKLILTQWTFSTVFKS
jgi:hypothetical protein